MSLRVELDKQIGESDMSVDAKVERAHVVTLENGVHVDGAVDRRRDDYVQLVRNVHTGDRVRVSV